MAASKVPCPRCNAVLKSAKPLPEGAQITCPQCQFGFRVPAQTAVAFGAANGAIAELQRDGIREKAVAQAAQSLRVAAPDPMGREGQTVPNRALRLGLVLGGTSLVLLLGGALLAVCLSGDGAAHKGNNSDADPAQQQVDILEPKYKPLAVSRPLIDLSPEDNAAVEDMVREGVKFLKKTQGPEGSWGGADQHDNYVAFGGLTLLECGVPAHDPAVQKAAKFARACFPRLNRTYTVALCLLFFERLNDPQDNGRLEQLAMRLVAGQSAQGGWDYTVPIHSEKDAAALAAFFRAHGKVPIETTRKSSAERLQVLPPTLRNLPVLHTPPDAKGEFFRQGGDNSNTQFALLALWAARRQHLPVEQSLNLVVRRFRNIQNPDGSFNYNGHGNAGPLPSMTGAGLLALAVGYGMADNNAGGGPQQDPSIQKALQHLSQFIGQPAPNRQANIAMTDIYFLWSTERVAVLYQLKKVMDKDWYQWGFTMLRKNQKPDGSWHSNQGHGNTPLVDTCFALLFLQRVNLAKDLTDKLNEIGAAPVSIPAGNKE